MQPEIKATLAYAISHLAKILQCEAESHYGAPGVLLRDQSEEGRIEVLLEMAGVTVRAAYVDDGPWAVDITFGVI